ncbi:hypothetical protein HMI55_006679 [Coelomomyces lativittatus]|nr:hypothetical protein HMI55_006679 [Coelomomyces lativittatus]
MAESLYFGSKLYNFEQNHHQAYLHYQNAFSAGCLIAHVGLGDCLYFGFADRRDLKQAQHHYMQVLKLTPLPPKLRARAWTGLGDCQFDVGDYVTALDAYLNSTQLDLSLQSRTQASKRAFSRLASMYIHGKGVKKDLETAKMYLKNARLCRREVIAKSEWLRANGEPQKADAYLEEYLWRFPIDY